MVYTTKHYGKYADKLIKKGISPTIVCISDVIRLLTEDEERCGYCFNTDNIVAGPEGELIKINTRDGIVEIYNSIMSDYYSLRVYDIATGELLPDGELSSSSNWVDSLNMYGEEKYYELLDLESNDFSKEYREKDRDFNEIDIRNREIYNDYTRTRLKETNLRQRLVEFSNKYSRRYNYVAEAMNKIILYIDDATSRRAKIEEFKSSKLRPETNEIISRKLYQIRLMEEAEAYSKISEAPIMEIIEEYKAYMTPKTDKIAKKYIKLSTKVNDILYPFITSRLQLLGKQTNAEDFERLERKHQIKFLKRRNELDRRDWGFYE